MSPAGHTSHNILRDSIGHVKSYREKSQSAKAENFSFHSITKGNGSSIQRTGIRNITSSHYHIIRSAESLQKDTELEVLNEKNNRYEISYLGVSQ